MKTKDKVLDILQNNSDRYISGEEIASRLFLTRAAVWKAIKNLKCAGYEIEAITNKGYRLQVDVELPSEELIREALGEYDNPTSNPMIGDLDIIVYDEVESTNDIAKRYALDNPGKSALIIASSQTKGRGRRGRAFFSPKGTGLYCSLILYPDTSIERVTRITSMMAVALSRAIEDCTGINVSIKWVNDIFYKDKKIAGILTEAVTSMEDEGMTHVVAGMGINLYMPAGGFPDDIKEIAGALLSDSRDRNVANKLIAAIVYRFNQILNEPVVNYLNEYRSRSMLIGHYVKVEQYNKNDEKKGNIYALVTGIDDDCHLCVRYENGIELVLSTGEVSVIKY